MFGKKKQQPIRPDQVDRLVRAFDAEEKEAAWDIDSPRSARATAVRNAAVSASTEAEIAAAYSKWQG